jgi:hypothetical protein
MEGSFATLSKNPSIRSVNSMLIAFAGVRCKATVATGARRQALRRFSAPGTRAAVSR